jgi:hypothetical protein
MKVPPAIDAARWRGVGTQKSIGTPSVQVKNPERTGKWLANLWSGKKITKKAHAGRGQEPKWEIPT